MESAWANNLSDQKLENVRQMILEENVPTQAFRMFAKETASKPVSINITEKSRKICAKTVCKLK